MRPVGSLFFPLDQRLKLGTEGYSPRLLKKIVRQSAVAPSFGQASKDLFELAEISISPSHVRRLAQRIGREWTRQRDQQVQAARQEPPPCEYAQPPPVAAVMLDGGRIQMRAAGKERGAHDPHWRETKVACCLTLSSQQQSTDPNPSPPRKFLDRVEVARLAAEIKRRVKAGEQTRASRELPGPKKKRKKKKKPGPKKLVRTVLATTADSEAFGWQVFCEVSRRGLGQAQRKACVCDGQKYNWSIFEMHLLALGFIPILDFVHLVTYLYGAAYAALEGASEGWQRYERWLRLAWSGKVSRLIGELEEASEQLGKPTRNSKEDDPKRVLAEALHYVEANRERMKYPRYRRQGLPITSAAVESVIKQINRRVKGTEKFWVDGGAEAMLQLSAAYLSEDDRAERYWSRPRPYAKAVGGGHLRPVAQ